MIIRAGRIYSAGCILPLSSNISISADLGTRHRAGLGMSENSDAVVVVVSEETGQISIALNGRLTRNYNQVTLREKAGTAADQQFRRGCLRVGNGFSESWASALRKGGLTDG